MPLTVPAEFRRRQECSGQLQGEVAAMFEDAVALCPAVRPGQGGAVVLH